MTDTTTPPADTRTRLEQSVQMWDRAEKAFAKAARREEKTGHPRPAEAYYDHDDTAVRFSEEVRDFVHAMTKLRRRVAKALRHSTAETPESDVLAEILELLEKGQN